MWSMVAQRLTQITPPAVIPDQLWQRVEAAWSAVPQEHIQSLFESLSRQGLMHTKSVEAQTSSGCCSGEFRYWFRCRPRHLIDFEITWSVANTLRVALYCQVIYSQFGLAIHPNDHQARRRFVEWAQNEIAVVPDFHKRILFSDEAHFWLNGYVNKQNCRTWSEANPQVYVETPLHPEKLTVWCALWAAGILLQKR
ncbi:uncharacterized protein TNCV_2376761 [Trichonephila clavipes]|nr:uncharacterized protein TNCV_2376761 [Trichonephila clavipes]